MKPELKQLFEHLLIIAANKEDDFPLPVVISAGDARLLVGYVLDLEKALQRQISSDPNNN